MYFNEEAKILAQEFPDHKIKTDESGICLFRFASLFSAQAAMIVYYWGRESKFDNTRSKEILKIQYTPVEKTLAEMGYSLIKVGLVENKGNLS